MKVLWEDGFEVEVPFGVSIQGMRDKERRPITVSITPEEILDSGISINHLFSYLRSLTNNSYKE